MAADSTHTFIPAGCLPVNIDQASIPAATRASIISGQWYFFTRRSDHLPTLLTLPKELQDILISSPSLAPYSWLWTQGWIRMAYASQPNPVGGRVRVYLLPHDINRSMQSLRSELTKLMPTLLHQLEYSQECWEGRDVYTPLPRPRLANHDGLTVSDESNSSLLDLFNQVPSPDPSPETASDANLQWAMQCLLESQIPGLITSLYPYQGRSAAKMLQRELEPGRVIDPRLRPVLDQVGQAWYYDDVSGVVLKEPRFYDEARGGILAEEMGTGKTLVCLALILSTKSEPSKPPEPFMAETPPRRNTGSLMDMAAAAANRHSVASHSGNLILKPALRNSVMTISSV